MSNKDRMPIEVFLPLYDAACKKKMTREQFAESIGVKPNTIYQRVYDLIRAGVPLEILPTESRMTLAQKAKKILSQLSDAAPSPAPKAKRQAEKPVEIKLDEAPVEKPVLANGSAVDELEQLLNG